MKHRNIFLTASIVLILSMTACGQSEPKETDAAQTTELESESESESETEKETKKSSKKDEDKTEETKKTASTTKPSSESTSSTSNSKPSSGSTSSTSNSKPSSGSTSGTSNSKPSSGSTSSSASKPSSGSTSGTSSSKPSSGSTSSSTSKPSTGNSESTSKPSVPETEAPHVHNWVEITHVEDQGCNVPIYGDWTYMGVSCNGCGTVFDSVDSWISHDGYMIDNYRDYGHGGYTEVWDKPITGYEWAEDLVTVSDGWQCSSCGATK